MKEGGGGKTEEEGEREKGARKEGAPKGQEHFLSSPQWVAPCLAHSRFE